MGVLQNNLNGEVPSSWAFNRSTLGVKTRQMSDHLMRAVCLGFGPKVPLWLKSIVIPGLGLWAFLRVLDMEIFCTSRHVFLVHAFGHGGDILAPNHLPSYSIFGYLSQETSQSDLISEENCVGKGIQWKSAI